MVWDTGTYAVSGEDPVRALHQGKLHLTLKGKKLKGEWTLVRMRRSEEEDKPQWLLLKSGADLPPISERAEDQSVLTRRSLAQIAKANDRAMAEPPPATHSREFASSQPAPAAQPVATRSPSPRNSRPGHAPLPKSICAACPKPSPVSFSR